MKAYKLYDYKIAVSQRNNQFSCNIIQCCWNAVARSSNATAHQMRPMNSPADPRSYNRWSVWRPINYLGFAENIWESMWKNDFPIALMSYHAYVHLYFGPNETYHYNDSSIVTTFYRWLSARLQYLQCINSGDTAVLCHALVMIKLPWWDHLFPCYNFGELGRLDMGKSQHCRHLIHIAVWSAWYDNILT